MTSEQADPQPTDDQIKLQALTEQFEKVRKENAELKHRVATLELEKAAPPETDPEPKEDKGEDSLENLVDESVERLFGKKAD